LNVIYAIEYLEYFGINMKTPNRPSNMKIISLPQDLNLTNTASIQLYDYRIYNSLLRSKISLTKNTFSFLREGTKEVVANDKPISIENNHFLIIKSGNCLMTETISNYQKTYHSILLFFTDEMLLNFIEKYEFEFTNAKTINSFVVCEYDKYIKHFVQSLEHIHQLNQQVQTQILKAKFEEIMVYLVQKEGKDFLNTLLNNQDDNSLRLTTIVENNKLKKLTLQELAFLCNMSVSTFKRAFIKHYEETPIKWFQNKRLEHAAFLLRTQKNRPIEIFEAAGYDNFSNFVQAFKKKYGNTPKQFQLQEMNF
jgi:AraC-like DNA-binding protein